MKKRLLCILLALTMVLGFLPPIELSSIASAAETVTPEPITSDYFYNQLNDRAKAIYDKLLTEFTTNKADYYEGTKSIDLMGLTYGENKSIGMDDVNDYMAGNKDLFNDFTAAKDALDLDHSELWYLDSGYLSFRVTHSSYEEGLSQGYHIMLGPGRGPNYLLAGQEIKHEDNRNPSAAASVADMDKEVEEVINGIVAKAITDAAEADREGTYSEQDKTAALIRSVHDQIISRISYRYEIECNPKSDNAKYIRTLYALVTHEGVCESYARAMQVCLTKLGVQCVLIHGVQCKGTPEDHMWNAVNIPENGVDHWYVVDATWDDPLTADWYGRRDLTYTGGKDGKENGTYLMVGQNVVGEYWRPSGYVSTGTFEFKYPTIETSNYDGSTAFQDNSGLTIKYSAGSGSMEDGTPAGVFKVSFQGMSQKEAAEKGFYFLLKMYDYHPDGTFHAMDSWYYCSAAIALLGNNKYFYDSPQDHGMYVYTGTCEYVEVAVTTREPKNYKDWATRTDWGPYWEEAYFNGSDDEIIAHSGMLYNTNSSYEAPPYVLSQTPAPNGTHTAGAEYDVRVTWDDDLYHPQADTPASIDSFVDNSAQAASQQVRVRYTTIQQDLHTGGDKVVQIVGELPFDADRDGYVDMDGDYTNFEWIYKYSDPRECKNKANHTNGACDVSKGCPIVGVAFKFRASDLWIDDLTEYLFSVEGVIGSRSSKFPNDFDITCMVPGLCPACYRSQGIDWNLWGQPTLLDAPENLDLYGMAVSGGTDKETLEALSEQMNVDNLNGRLMLVVEDKSKGKGSREDYEEINDALGDEGNFSEDEVIGSSVFEINFNRICPMVKLKPNQGQSLRVQVGYPAGVTYESLGAGEVELKAYHFTRCANNDTDRCGNYENPGHNWGDDIVGVDEIEIIPTPYGMVIICNAFSPFEIVAVKKDPSEISTVASTVKESTVVVVSDSNGKVLVDGEEAVGTAGNVKFTGTETKTFTVEPKAGYVLDTVSLGGKEISVNKGTNTFTLTSGDGENADVTQSDVLSVTFLPETIKLEEEAQHLSTVVAAVCSHSEYTVTKQGVPATCTKAGKTEEHTCNNCNMVIQQQTDIPATGHTPVTTSSAVDPTCETSGKRAVVKCSTCNTVLSNGEKIAPLGHLFLNYETLEDSGTCKGTTKTAKCERENCNATDTINVPELSRDHLFTTYVNDDNATCTKNATETAYCDYGCGAIKVRELEGTKLEHTNEKGYCKYCGEYLCANGHTLVDDEAVDPTCTTDGKTAGRHCSVCGHVDVNDAQQPIPAKGHNFPEAEHDEQVYCTVCGAPKPTQPHTEEVIPAVPATCDTEGLTEGKKCAVCGDIIEAQTTIPALGHQFDVSQITWNWSEEGEVSASASVPCTREGCGHAEVYPATVEMIVKTEPTCAQEGESTYQATVVIDGETYTDTDENHVFPIEKLAHTVEEWTTNSDASCIAHGTESGTCAVCGQTVTRDRNEYLPHNYVYDLKKSTPVTCTVDGTMVSVCSVCGDEQRETVAAKGHTEVTIPAIPPTCTEVGDSAGTKCSVCDTIIVAPIEVPALGHDFVEGKCTRCGEADPDYFYSEPSPGNPDPAPGTSEDSDEPETPWTNPFGDVPGDAWYLDELEFVSKRGLISGYEDGTFRPMAETTRAQILTILARLDGVDTSGSDPWYAAGQKWAVEKGISDGTMLDEELTREQLATMLYRFAGEPEVEEGFELPAFKDAGEISAWAKDAMTWAVWKGIVEGKDPVTLCPHETAVRSHVVTMLARFCLEMEME